MWLATWLTGLTGGSVRVLNAGCEAITIAGFAAWGTRRCSSPRRDRGSLRCGRPSLFHQMWPWCWRIAVVVADDLAMACQAPTVGANVDPQRGTPPLALDPSRKLPFATRKYSTS